MTYEALCDRSAAELLRYTVQESTIDNLIIHYGSLRKLSDATLTELLAQGLTRSKATKLMAVLQIARIYATEPEERTRIASPSDVVALLRDMEAMDRECFKTISLGTKNHILAVTTVSIGALDYTIAAPREVFKVPIMRSAASIILVHNHPSGDSEPSYQDHQLTKRLRECGTTLGIEVIDHIVIGKNCHVSMKERGML